MSKNKISQKAYNQAYHVIHRDEIRLRKKVWSEANKDKMEAYNKVYFKINKDKIKLWRKTYYETNKDKKRAYGKAYYKLHKDKISSRARAYYKKNKRKIIICNSVYIKEKRKINPMFRLSLNISAAISIALKGNKNGRHWEDLVDYTLDKLKKHLEKQFVEGMTWDNYGKNGWHIDHKIPKAVFNYTKPEHDDFLKCFALSNLQPLWAEDNLSKSNKLTKPFQPSLLA